MQVTYGLPIPVKAAYDLTVSGASSASAAFDPLTAWILVTATTDCRVRVGAATPTAVATDTLVSAGVPYPFQVLKGKGWMVAVIQESAGGKLSVTELPE